MADGTAADPPVFTVLEARVPRDQWVRLTETYRSALGKLPPQMLQTFLTQSADDPARWWGVSVWRSRAALEEYRRSVETPRGVLMFRSVGAEPTLSLWTVAASG